VLAEAQAKATLDDLRKKIDASANPETWNDLREKLDTLQKQFEAYPKFDPATLLAVQAALSDLQKQFDDMAKFDPAAAQAVSTSLNKLAQLVGDHMAALAVNECTDQKLDDAAALSAALAAPSVPPQFPPLVPMPVFGSISADTPVRLTSSSIILTQGKDNKLDGVAQYLQTILKGSTNFTFPIDPPTTAKLPCIKLEIKEPANAQLGSEGYSLISAGNGIVIRSATAAGLFNGVQTLLQLLPAKVYSKTSQVADWIVPVVKTVDWPRFAYRSTMLDVARRFYTVDQVKRYIDEVALLKINVLHLHLTDDQGWRIAIDALPELTKIGGTTQSGFPSRPENQWFYTGDQYKGIVSYAASRFITIVPEIDGPGHSLAAQASIANLNCNNTKRAPYSGFDVGNPTVCLDDPAHIANMNAYLKTVIATVAALTPGPYLHIGGDEAPNMTAAKMSAYVDGAVAPILEAKKKLIGWHQIAQGTLPAGSVLQYWGDESYRSSIGAASEGSNIAEVRSGLRQGAQFITSPGDHAYLDMKYDKNTPYGLSWEGLVTIQKSYDWDPTTILSSTDGKISILAEKDILGVEAALWADRAFTNSLGSLPTAPDARFVSPTVYTDYMAFPRIASIAEIGWSPRTSHSWENFKTRLGYQGARWEAFGVGYFKSTEISWTSPSSVFVFSQ